MSSTEGKICHDHPRHSHLRCRDRRVLIARDNGPDAPHLLWDTANGTLAHHIADRPAYRADVSPNGRYLAAMVDDGASGTKLSVWLLDGEKPMLEPAGAPPASAGPP
jgi:hypothetical protein